MRLSLNASACVHFFFKYLLKMFKTQVIDETYRFIIVNNKLMNFGIKHINKNHLIALNNSDSSENN